MFDVVVGNPPFSKNLHLKIIDKAVRHLTEDGVSCFIHPARWYIDPLYKYKKNCDRLKFSYIVDRLDDVKLIDVLTMNRKFGIQMNCELMISKIRGYITNKTLDVYDRFSRECIDIVLPYCEKNNLGKFCEKEKIDGWRVQINRIVPFKSEIKRKDFSARKACVNVVQDKSVFYDGFDGDVCWNNVRYRNQYSKNVLIPLPYSIQFKTEQEAINFKDSCRCNFYFNMVQMLKVDLNTPIEYLPWMQDYTHPWTDKDYCEFFGRLGMSRECQEWMCRDVYDYRVKDYIDYLDLSCQPSTSPGTGMIW